eukprot:Blabericola_migrator_1__25@NODE_1007_length_5718_cov_113_774022_g229_i2_p1_GENE_NODE_1007_length_5718_cov_113_774022_g229_i2NODE_1007_length_5718_cov_113_774022_g229_i2_p1_ORF_typecomplete_len698_score115_19DUF2339/PF10101_9/1_3e05Bax1I/PF01027_20/0_00021Bax1I/PF01027_20/1_3WTF/PF03303_13/1_4e03WTF/PF03303_13/0_4WTF/PF03303_13/2_4e02_NODE_1007_length_5718_cov_113_774022_g229_i222794372
MEQSEAAQTSVDDHAVPVTDVNQVSSSSGWKSKVKTSKLQKKVAEAQAKLPKIDALSGEKSQDATTDTRTADELESGKGGWFSRKKKTGKEEGDEKTEKTGWKAKLWKIFVGEPPDEEAPKKRKEKKHCCAPYQKFRYGIIPDDQKLKWETEDNVRNSLCAWIFLELACLWLIALIVSIMCQTIPSIKEFINNMDVWQYVDIYIRHGAVLMSTAAVLFSGLLPRYMRVIWISTPYALCESVLLGMALGRYDNVWNTAATTAVAAITAVALLTLALQLWFKQPFNDRTLGYSCLALACAVGLSAAHPGCRSIYLLYAGVGAVVITVITVTTVQGLVDREAHDEREFGLTHHPFVSMLTFAIIAGIAANLVSSMLKSGSSDTQFNNKDVEKTKDHTEKQEKQQSADDAYHEAMERPTSRRKFIPKEDRIWRKMEASKKKKFKRKIYAICALEYAIATIVTLVCIWVDSAKRWMQPRGSDISFYVIVAFLILMLFMYVLPSWTQKVYVVWPLAIGVGASLGLLMTSSGISGELLSIGAFLIMVNIAIMWRFGFAGGALLGIFIFLPVAGGLACAIPIYRQWGILFTVLACAVITLLTGILPRRMVNGNIQTYGVKDYVYVGLTVMLKVAFLVSAAVTYYHTAVDAVNRTCKLDPHCYLNAIKNGAESIQNGANSVLNVAGDAANGIVHGVNASNVVDAAA